VLKLSIRLGWKNRKSPEPTAQPRKHLVTRDESSLSAFNLTNTALNLDSPCLLDFRIGLPAMSAKTSTHTNIAAAILTEPNWVAHL